MQQYPLLSRNLYSFCLFSLFISIFVVANGEVADLEKNIKKYSLALLLTIS